MCPAPVLGCATDIESRFRATRQIALNTSHDEWIYRFRPGSFITISVDENSFGQHTVNKGLHLRQGLELTLSTLNHLNIGITFYCIPAEVKQRRFVEVRYGGDATSVWPDGSTSTIWADTQVPQPDRRHQYTINIYSATLEPEYFPVTTNILQHEVAHLLSMRHHPAVPAYRREAGQVLFPAGDNETESIMGAFAHPGDLFFRSRDIKYLKNFFKMKAGDKIDGKAIVDVAVP